jgi:hypothetical protein
MRILRLGVVCSFVVKLISNLKKRLRMKNLNNKIIEELHSLDKSLQVEIMNQLQPYDIHVKLGSLLSTKINRCLKWQLTNEVRIGLIRFRNKKRYG